MKQVPPKLKLLVPQGLNSILRFQNTSHLRRKPKQARHIRCIAKLSLLLYPRGAQGKEAQEFHQTTSHASIVTRLVTGQCNTLKFAYLENRTKMI
jgi:hypothetical protein